MLKTPFRSPVKLVICLTGGFVGFLLETEFVLHARATVSVVIRHRVRVAAIAVYDANVHPSFVGCDFQCVLFYVPKPSSEVLAWSNNHAAVRVEERKPLRELVCVLAFYEGQSVAIDVEPRTLSRLAEVVSQSPIARISRWRGVGYVE